MQIDKRNRAELKRYFVKNAIPTESNFAELIDGMLSQRDDGIAKLPNDALSIEAAGDDTSQKKAIHFYGNFRDADPIWVLSLNPRQNPADPATARPGFSISDSAGNSRLFVERGTGRVGLGTVTPRARLDLPTGDAWIGRGLNIGAPSDGVNAAVLNLHNESNRKYWHVTVRAGEADKLVFNRNDASGAPWAAVLKLGMDGNVEAAGSVRANRFTSDNTLALNNYATLNPASNVYLSSPPGDRDAWLYLDSADTTNNWGIYHRQLNTPIGGLPGNSIGFIGGGTSKLQAYIGLADGAAFFAGNVGLGTQAPVSSLHIRRDATGIAGPIITLTNGTGSPNTGGAIDFNGYDAAAHPPTLRLRSLDDGNFSSHLAVYTKNSGGLANPLTERMRLTSSGNLGIGTATPRGRLDVPTGDAWLGRVVNITAPSDGTNAGVLNFHNETNLKFWHITHRGGEADKLIFWRNDASTYASVLKLGMDGLVEAPYGALLSHIGIGSQAHGAIPYAYETIQMNAGHNLRIYFGTTERFILERTGQFTIKFDQGFWRFQNDGNLVKYNSAGVAIWALNNVSGRAGW